MNNFSLTSLLEKKQQQPAHPLLRSLMAAKISLTSVFDNGACFATGLLSLASGFFISPTGCHQCLIQPVSNPGWFF